MSHEAQQALENEQEAQAQAGRAGTYRLLASMLCDAPAEVVLQHVAALPDTFDEKDAMSAAFKAVIAAAKASTTETVADEYHALFIGLGRGELVPFGSFYLTGFLMEKPLGVLREDLSELGFTRQPGVKEPEDQIGFLCEVMALLIEEGVSFEKQKSFYEKHIGPWAMKFFEDLVRAESAEFYKAIGGLGHGFIEFETAYFSMPS